jgi:tetratricopeptide (TPR) repeat protein
MSKIIPLPRYNGPKVRRRKFSKALAPVLSLANYRAPLQPKSAEDLYNEASQIDEIPTQYEKAAALYLEAIRVDPRHARSVTNLGNIRFRQHETEIARQLYSHALELDPNQPEAHYNLGYLHLERGDDINLAQTHLRRAVELDPKFTDAWFNLGMCLEQQGRPLQAAHAFRQYTRLEPVGSWSDIARRHY